MDWHEQSLGTPKKALLFSVHSNAAASCAQPQLLPRVNLGKQERQNRLLVNQVGSDRDAAQGEDSSTANQLHSGRGGLHRCEQQDSTLHFSDMQQQVIPEVVGAHLQK